MTLIEDLMPYILHWNQLLLRYFGRKLNLMETFVLNFKNLSFPEMSHILLYDSWVENHCSAKLRQSIKFQYRLRCKNDENVFVKLFTLLCFSATFRKHHARTCTLVFVRQTVFSATIFCRHFSLFVGNKQVEMLNCIIFYASLPLICT